MCSGYRVSQSILLTLYAIIDFKVCPDFDHSINEDVMDLSIVIPCYNEIETVPKLKRELRPVVLELAQTRTVEIIFVDDGSVDNTYSALHSAFIDDPLPNIPIRIEQHNPNQGLGAAIRTGLNASRGEVVVTTDSDGTYRFTEIENLLALLTPEIDIVTASPYHPEGDVAGVSAYRLLFSKGASAMYRILADRRVHTYTALFRAYRRSVVDNVHFEANGFLAGTELMVRAMRMGYHVAEYPTVLHSRVTGVSHAKIARTVRSHLEYQFSLLGTEYPYGTIIQGEGASVYAYEDGIKRLFPSSDVFDLHGYKWAQIVKVDDKFLANLPNGPEMTFREGTLLRGTSDLVYVIEHGQKRAIPAAEIFEGLGYHWSDILVIADVGTGSVC